jgi:hypothetical protein
LEHIQVSKQIAGLDEARLAIQKQISIGESQRSKLLEDEKSISIQMEEIQ